MRAKPPQGEVSLEVRLLTASPLFDVEWYANVSGCEKTRAAAIRHYLDDGHRKGLSPHPLFNAEYYVSQLDKEADKDQPVAPFAHYLMRAQSPEVSPSPLFDTAAYAKAHPDAREHPHGLLAHYMRRGSAPRARPNDWFVPRRGGPPDNLADWVRARRAEWVERDASVPRLARALPRAGTALADTALAEDAEEFASELPAWTPGGEPLVSIVVPVGVDLSLARETLMGVLAQTMPGWELLVLHAHDPVEIAVVVGDIANDDRVQVIPQHAPGFSQALNDGIALARGSFLAWVHGGDIWEPGYLERAFGALRAERAQSVHTATLVRSPAGKAPAKGARDKATTDEPRPTRARYAAAHATRERLAAGVRVDLSALVVSRSLAVEVGGFDESLLAAADHDFVLKIARKAPLAFVPDVGVTRDDERRSRDADPFGRLDRPLVDHGRIDAWHDVVLNRHTIDWAALAARPSVPGTVSVIIPTHQDWRMTTRAVQCVATAAAESPGLKVQTIVLNNGCAAETSVVLDSLPLRFPGVRVVHSPVNHGFALGNNRAFEHATGGVIVFLNNDTEVALGWLEPLVRALEDPEVLGAQGLLVYPSGTIQSAGVAFPVGGGLPHEFLRGFPVEDTAGLESAAFSAVTGAALAMRRSDVVALRGFDPVFRNGMEDVDLGLRMKRLRPGRFTVRPDSIVVHHESKSPGRFTNSLTNRGLWLERWGDDVRGDDVTLWEQMGYEIVRHEVRGKVAKNRRLDPPEPQLVRRPPLSVVDGLPALRWAIKNPAPNDASGEFWGDTHFARQLARALRRLGQQVVIDHRPEFERRTGTFDDVVLVLRGLTPYRPMYGQVNLLWLISHPEALSRAEAECYDRVLAASFAYAQRTSRKWGIRIDPLLQGTDPELFHPDRARPDTGHPVLFVGGSRKQHRPIILGAVEQGLPLSVYGPDWEDRIPRPYVKAPSFPNDQLGAAYRSAGVVLNDHWEAMRVDGFISNRLFDAVASGARVITDDVTGLGAMFGRSVQVVRDLGDLKLLTSAPDLDAIFGADEERREVAARIHAEHSFDARARELLRVALEVRSSIHGPRRDAAGTDGPATGPVGPAYAPVPEPDRVPVHTQGEQ